MPGVVAIAMPGHDGAVPVDRGWDANIDALAARVRRIAPAGHHLVGYSLGARLALGLLVRHPDLAARATLISAQLGLETAGERSERRGADARWSAMLRGSGVASFVDAWEALPMWASQARLDRRQLETQRSIRMSHDADALATCLDELGLAAMPDYRDALGAIDCDVVLVTGALDGRFEDIASEAIELQPRWRHHSVPGVGHNVVLEAPEALRAWA